MSTARPPSPRRARSMSTPRSLTAAASWLPRPRRTSMITNRITITTSSATPTTSAVPVQRPVPARRAHRPAQPGQPQDDQQRQRQQPHQQADPAPGVPAVPASALPPASPRRLDFRLSGWSSPQERFLHPVTGGPLPRPRPDHRRPPVPSAAWPSIADRSCQRDIQAGREHPRQPAPQAGTAARRQKSFTSRARSWLSAAGPPAPAVQERDLPTRSRPRPSSASDLPGPRHLARCGTLCSPAAMAAGEHRPERRRRTGAAPARSRQARSPPAPRADRSARAPGS